MELDTHTNSYDNAYNDLETPVRSSQSENSYENSYSENELFSSSIYEEEDRNLIDNDSES